MDDMRTAVDVDTGEIFYAPKVKPKVKAGWCRMFQIKLEEIAKDRDLRGMPISVYLFMISKVDYDNICRFPQILIADELGTTAQYVSKSIRLLREKKIITEIKQRGTLVKAYSFNSKYIVKGKQDKKAAIVDETGEVIVEAEEPEADPVIVKKELTPAPRKKPAKVEVILPDFLDKPLWDDFLAHRKKLKAPNTERSLNSLLKKLSGFYNDGHDINLIIQKSYDNGWKDVFEPKGGLNGGNNSKPHRTSIEQDLQFDDWG